eukprot:SAG11_NODE_8535_length_1004_cov_1.116022_2_plen_88_part_00
MTNLRAAGHGVAKLRMNCEQFTVPEVEVDLQKLPDVLQCLLDTIMFNRALGVVRPSERTTELFNVTWVQCGDPKVTPPPPRSHCIRT